MKKEFVWPKVDINFPLEKHTIILALAGSKSYGTDHPLSDTDYKGVLIVPEEILFSPFKSFEQVSWKGEGVTGRVSEGDGVLEADEEGTIFGLQKFANLCASCNPNVIELLFVDEKHLIKCSEAGLLLRNNRDLFLSQRALQTFTGYALSQLKRIKTHKSCIENPVLESPTRKDFGLPEEKIIRPDQAKAAKAFVRRNTNQLAPWLLEQDTQWQGAFWDGIESLFSLLLQESQIERDFENESWIDVRDSVEDKVAQTLGFDANFIEYLKKEKAYEQKRRHYKQYKSWLKNRNPARAELESKYGIDTKHAMHLVRLLRMGEEVLREKTLRVFRPDREELKQIRNGSWSYEKLIDWSQSKVDELYDFVRSGKCELPEKPDRDRIEELTIQVQKTFEV